MDYAVKPLREHLVDLGKARLFYAVDGPLAADVTPVHWDGGSELFLKELGLTEGEISQASNEEYSDLKLPEYTGPVPIKRYYTGEAPVISANIFLADPALRAIISPTGTAGAGFESQQPVQLLTLVAFPEMLFRGAVGQPLGTLSYAGGVWQLNAAPIAESLDRYIGQIMWFWSAAPSRAVPSFQHTEGGRALAPVEFTLIQDLELPFPEGDQIYTVGDPADVGIDIEGGS